MLCKRIFRRGEKDAFLLPPPFPPQLTFQALPGNAPFL